MTIGARASCGAAQVHAGDVVLYRESNEPGLHLHRAIAGPGSVVEITHGRVFVNKAPITLSSLDRETMPFSEDMTQSVETFAERAGSDKYRIAILNSDGMFENMDATRVPPDAWFLIGDNRDNSRDSRSDGPVKQKDICGVAERVLWSERRQEIGRKP